MFIIKACCKLSKQCVYLMSTKEYDLFTDIKTKAYLFNNKSDALVLLNRLKELYPEHEFTLTTPYTI